MIVQRVDVRQWQGYLPLLKKKMTEHNATCEMCGFQSPKFMSLSAVSFLRGYDEVSESVLRLTCPVCHDAMCFNLARSKGNIIALPEFSQKVLNSIVYAHWAIQCAVNIIDRKTLNEQTDSNLSALQKNLNNIIVSLVTERVKPVNTLFAYDVSTTYSASEPGELGACILSMTDAEVKSVLEGQVLANLRYLPNEDAYENQIKFWSDKLFSKLTLQQLHKICIFYHDYLEENGVLKTLV